MKNQGFRYREQGGVIVWILVLIALFAALSFAATRGSRSGMSNMDKEKVGLSANEVISSAQAIREAVRTLKIKGCQDTKLSFEAAAMGPAYDNTGAPSDFSCHVFNGAGGGISYAAPQDEWLDISSSSETFYGGWMATASASVDGLGLNSNGAGACAANEDCKELIWGLPYINLSLCQAINRKLGFGGADGLPPQDTGGIFSTSTAVPFAGTFPATGSQMGTASTNYSAKMSGCVEGSGDPAAGTYHFYQVLISH